MKKSNFQKMKLIVSFMLIAVMTVFFAANNRFASSDTAIAAEKPTISKTSRRILIGEKYDLNIKNKISKSTYKWESSDKKIAVVDSKGVVTAKSKGTAIITCTITTPEKEVFVETCKVTVIEPALKFRISNKISMMNVGQEYDLNRKLAPNSSNDKTTWTTSDASIAKPDSLGKFTALKEGTVTITGTTLSGASDSVTITVVDKDGIVKNQEELDAMLGSGAELITIKTNEEIKLTIKGGIYKNQKLLVDAPNADIVNYGEFKSIEIKRIKNNTWYEGAKGNQITITAKDARIIVGPSASVKVEVKAEGTVLRIENNGTIEEILLDNEAEIEISGESKELIPITINASNVKLTTSVPIDLMCNEKLELVLLDGAQESKIKAASKEVLPTVKSDFKIKVNVGDQEVDIPITNITPTVPSGGGSTYDPTPSGKVYRLNNNMTLKDVKSVTVKFGALKFKISSATLDDLKDFLDNKEETIEKWKNTVKTTKVYDGQEFEVTGEKGSLTKKVVFKGGLLNGRSYEATVNPGSNSVTVKGQSLTFTIEKLDDRSIRITPEPSFDLEFHAE